MYVCAILHSLGAPGHWELVFLAYQACPPCPQKSKSKQKGLNKKLNDKELNRTIL